jgi:hypothetical protein
LGRPEQQLKIVSLGTQNPALEGGRVGAAQLLGADANLPFSQASDALVINIPENLPGKDAFVFKLRFQRT